MAKLVIDLSGRAGLAPKFYGDVNDTTSAPQRRYLGKDGEMAQGISNPLRYYGYTSPATNSFVTITETDATNSFTSQATASIYDSNSQDYFFAERNVIWVGDDATDFTFSDVFAGSNVAGATITDLEIYQVNGTRRLFFSYKKAAGGDIGIAALPSAVVDNDFFSTAPSGAFATGAATDVFMMVADNGFMYIADGNALHKFNGNASGGANGTSTGNVLLFPNDFIIVDGIDWRGHLWLGVQTATPTGVANTAAYSERIVGVYVWDRITTQFGQQDFIPITGAKEIRKIYVSPSGEMRVITISSDRFVQVRRYNGATFEVIEEFGINAYPGYRDSFTQFGGLATWLGNDGIFYAHGSLAPGQAEGTYTIGDITGVTTTTVTPGAILLLDGNQSTSQARSGIIWSAKGGSTTYYRKWYPHGEGTINSVAMNGHAGGIYTLANYLPKLSTLEDVVIMCRPTSTGSTTIATVSVYLNQSATAFKNETITLDKASKGYIHIPIAKPYVNAVQLKITYPTGTTLGTDDFTPAVAIVNYTPTGTYK